MTSDSQIYTQIEHAKDGFGIIEPKQATALINHLTPQDWAQAAKLFPKDAGKPDGFSIQANGNDITIHNDMSQAKKIAGESNAMAAFDGMKQDFRGACFMVGVGVPSELAFTGMMGAIDGSGFAAGVLFGGEIAAAVVAIPAALDYGSNLMHADSFKADAARISQQSTDVTAQSKSNTTVNAHLT